MSGRRAAGLIDAARLDPAGALAGAADACSRGGFIAMAGAGALALALPAAASAKDAAANDTAILNFALTLEYLQAAFYTEAERLNALTGLAAAASIHSVEARHAAWIRYVAGVAPAADALDDPIADADARALVARTGFVRPRPATVARSAPAFTG